MHKKNCYTCKHSGMYRNDPISESLMGLCGISNMTCRVEGIEFMVCLRKSVLNQIAYCGCAVWESNEKEEQK